MHEFITYVAKIWLMSLAPGNLLYLLIVVILVIVVIVVLLKVLGFVLIGYPLEGYEYQTPIQNVLTLFD